MSDTPLLDAVLAHQERVAAAKARVESFLDAWEGLSDRGEMIYGLGVKNEDATRDLTTTDLRLLLGEMK